MFVRLKVELKQVCDLVHSKMVNDELHQKTTSLDGMRIKGPKVF